MTREEFVAEVRGRIGPDVPDHDVALIVDIAEHAAHQACVTMVNTIERLPERLQSHGTIVAVALLTLRMQQATRELIGIAAEHAIKQAFGVK